MKGGCWQKVIVCWANALQLTEDPILDISDLMDCSFFLKLLKQLKHNFEITSDVNKRNVIDKFIEENYVSIKVKTILDYEEITLIGSLMLLTSSLDVSHLRDPLYSLPTDTQLSIQAFIEKFLSIPKESVTRDTIYDVIEEIDSTPQCDESCFISSPSAVCYSEMSGLAAPSSFNSVTKNKVKYLENQVEVLNFDRLHLQEELEATRQDLINLGNKYVSKEQELLHTKNELFILKNQIKADETSQNKVLIKKELENEISVLKDDLSLLQVNLCFSSNELASFLNENEHLKIKLSKEESGKLHLKKKLEETENKLNEMSSTLEEMESQLSALKITCQEQEELLHEKRIHIADESVSLINEPCVMPVCTGESLGLIIEMKYAELQEETARLKEMLAIKEDKIINLEKLLLTKGLGDLFCEKSSTEDIDQFFPSEIQLNYIELLEEENGKLKASLSHEGGNITIVIDPEESTSKTTVIKESIELNNLKTLNETDASDDSLDCSTSIDNKFETSETSVSLENEIENVDSDKILKKDESLIEVLKNVTLKSSAMLEHCTVFERDEQSQESEIDGETNAVKQEGFLSKQEIGENKQYYKKHFNNYKVDKQTEIVLSKLSPTDQPIIEKLKFGLGRVHEMFEMKGIRLKETVATCEKLRKDLSKNEKYGKVMAEKLKRALSKNVELECILSLYQTEINDLRSMLFNYENQLSGKTCAVMADASNVADRISKTEKLVNQMDEYEKKLHTCMETLVSKDKELINFQQIFEKNKKEMDSLKNELHDKVSLIAELRNDVDMCQHEKSVLEKQIENLVKDIEKNESLKIKLKISENEIARLNKELEQERVNLKIVQNHIELEDKFNNAFDVKLKELQAKMKQQFEKELNGTVEEYLDKINQLKMKATKDKLHIQELSEDLWNTTDKLLLSQQQCIALQNQLRRTKCALEILNNSSANRHSAAGIQPVSNPCLWSQPEDDSVEIEPFLEDPLSLVTRKGITWKQDKNIAKVEALQRFSFVLNSLPKNSDEQLTKIDDEVFNDDFMQDLKDGICRLPVSNDVTNLQRASCPPIAKIAYCKPGPPTPCRAGGARLSLQNFEKPYPTTRKFKENQNTLESRTNTNTNNCPSRLSKLFSSVKGQHKAKTLSQESPQKVKKKNFFQRKFGLNRENIPL